MKGIKRIKVLSSEIENKATLKLINYLLSRNELNERVKALNEEKSLKQMIEYIRSVVQKDVRDGMAFVEEEYVYNLAIHYFDESNEKLGFKNENPKIEVEKSKPVLKSLEQSCKEVEEMGKEEAIEESKEEITLRITNNKFLPEGQLSLF